jgi:uncharacterized cofD-like protein
MNQPNIVVIGGGTGSFTLLRSLKKLTPNISALVNMADDGGSTGVLRDELGVLPPGDIRQCLVALSEAPEELRELFNFRFATGTFKGHSFGNIFLSAVEKMTDDFNDSVRIASDVLRITGRVLPITLDNHKLVLNQGSEKIVGEYLIGNTRLMRRPALSLEPEALLNPLAKQVIADADLIVIAPGNLYCSLVPALLVEGLPEALRQSKAKVAYVCNLVNKTDQTPDFMTHDYADEIERFLGPGVLDFMLYNTDLPDDDLLEKYAVMGEYPVLFDVEKLEKAPYEAVPGDFLSHAPQTRNANDSMILRSLIRHDGDAIAKMLLHLS